MRTIVAGSRMHYLASSKDYLQTKLDNARVACTHHLAEMNRIDQGDCADMVEVGVIQHIRSLRAKLNIHSFMNAGVFEQGSIPTPGARPEYRTSAGVAGSNAFRGRVGK